MKTVMYSFRSKKQPTLQTLKLLHSSILNQLRMPRKYVQGKSQLAKRSPYAIMCDIRYYRRSFDHMFLCSCFSRTHSDFVSNSGAMRAGGDEEKGLKLPTQATESGCYSLVPGMNSFLIPQKGKAYAISALWTRLLLTFCNQVVGKFACVSY